MLDDRTGEREGTGRTGSAVVGEAVPSALRRGRDGDRQLVEDREPGEVAFPLLSESGLPGEGAWFVSVWNS